MREEVKTATRKRGALTVQYGSDEDAGYVPVFVLNLAQDMRVKREELRHWVLLGADVVHAKLLVMECPFPEELERVNEGNP